MFSLKQVIENNEDSSYISSNNFAQLSFFYGPFSMSALTVICTDGLSSLACVSRLAIGSMGL